MNDQKISQVIRDYDAAHPYWKQEKRECEIKEAQEAEERARQATPYSRAKRVPRHSCRSAEAEEIIGADQFR